MAENCNLRPGTGKKGFFGEKYAEKSCIKLERVMHFTRKSEAARCLVGIKR